MQEPQHVKCNHDTSGSPVPRPVPPPMPRPVFSDPTRHRTRLVGILGTVALFGLLTWATLFGLGLYYLEKLPQSDMVAQAQLRDPALSPLFAVPADGLFTATGADTASPMLAHAAAEECTGAPLEQAQPVGMRPLVYAHLPYWPDWAHVALAGVCDRIDVLLPEWYEITDPARGLVTLEIAAGHQQAVRAQIARLPGPSVIFPVIVLQPDVWSLLPESDVAPMHLLAAEIAGRILADGHQGVCLATDGLPASKERALAVLLGALASRLAPDGLLTCLITRHDADLLGNPLITNAPDRVVVKTFAEPWIGALAGPLAAQPDFAAILLRLQGQIGPERLVVALGNHARDWTTGAALPERIGYAETMRRAARHDGRITLPATALNTRIELTDDQGQRHDIWMLDAISAHNQLRAMQALGLHRVAIWSLGHEDPGLWSLLQHGETGTQAVLDRLQNLRFDAYVGYEGAGAFRHILEAENPGQRLLSLDAEGMIIAQSYDAVPRPYTIRRFGQGAPGDIALTFDDGPDLVFTSQILDILQEKQVSATFFVIGRNVLRARHLVRRMVAEGHEIGSHSFFHPRFDGITSLRAIIELNAVQRLLASVTGHRTVLFRAPYGMGHDPRTQAQVRPMVLLDGTGYVVVGTEITPPDWTNPQVDQIIDYVFDALDTNMGNVIVLHDAGGDRSVTVEALPLLIDQLRAEGYRLVPLHSLMGVERAVLMPVVDKAPMVLDRVTFNLMAWAGPVLIWLFWIAIVAGAVRSLLFLGLALRRGRRPAAAPATAPDSPPVTVVLPALNEEMVIVSSIRTVLASDYPNLQVIVIDNGSTDHTLDEARQAYGNDPRVTIITEQTRGKWMAIDAAYDRIDTQIVIALDADTLLDPDAIRRLVRHFDDPRVGAVAGNVKVGNRRNLLTRLQALEYITMQNIDRRATETFNGILVVPGAIGAWRADAVRKAGLYTNETLAEDADLTVSVLRAGYRIVFDEHALSHTEAPETLRAFMKQRFRWTFGMMQTAWKHRRAAREGRAVGLVSIPDLAIFGVALSLLAPIADLVLLAALTDLAVSALTSTQVQAVNPASMWIVAGWLALPLLDLLTAAIALRFERTEQWRLLWLMPLQRLIYRPLLYITVYRALTRAITGRLGRWGKGRRRGSVSAAQLGQPLPRAGE